MLIQKLSDAPSPTAGAFGDVVISPPAHAPAQPVPPPPRAVEPTLLQVQTAVEQANKMLRSLAATLEFEIDRQIGVLRSGGTIVQETRLWDAGARETVSMRSKEDAHDYRYFPEPDLPPVQVDASRIAEIRASILELPEARRSFCKRCCLL